MYAVESGKVVRIKNVDGVIDTTKARGTPVTFPCQNAVKPVNRFHERNPTPINLKSPPTRKRYEHNHDDVPRILWATLPTV